MFTESTLTDRLQVELKSHVSALMLQKLLFTENKSENNNIGLQDYSLKDELVFGVSGTVNSYADSKVKSPTGSPAILPVTSITTMQTSQPHGQTRDLLSSESNQMKSPETIHNPSVTKHIHTWNKVDYKYTTAVCVD